MFSQWNFHNLLMSHISGWNMKKLSIKSWYYTFLPVYIGVTHRTTDKTIFSWNDQPHKILLFMLCLFSLMVLDEAHLYEIICVFTDTQYFFILPCWRSRTLMIYSLVCLKISKSFGRKYFASGVLVRAHLIKYTWKEFRTKNEKPNLKKFFFFAQYLDFHFVPANHFPGASAILHSAHSPTIGLIKMAVSVFRLMS